MIHFRRESFLFVLSLKNAIFDVVFRTLKLSKLHMAKSIFNKIDRPNIFIKKCFRALSSNG